ncbi:MAG TPA: hypothetical protein G4N94_03710 [Caldilineae bacterium]|nr:hypothetical protein [Caldilineae bacterium]
MDDLTAMEWNIFGKDPMLVFVFRPVERLINAIDISVLGVHSFLFSHLMGLTGFIASVYLVYFLARRLLVHKERGALLVALGFSAMTSNVLSIVQVDSLSQQFATMFTLLALLTLIRAISDRKSFSPLLKA